MQPRTQATLDKLRSVEWFRSVGLHDTDKADVLSSWEEAIQSCQSREWENLCLRAANQFSDRLIERSLERYRRWNDIVDEVKPHSMELVREKTGDVVARHNLPKVFIDDIDWNILHLCIECEYADVFPAGFFAGMSYWYWSGHFPCGWRGAFPDGRLVIY